LIKLCRTIEKVAYFCRMRKIEFRQATGEPLQLDIAEDATIGAMKSALAAVCQADPANLVLYLHSYRLQDTWTIADVDLKDDSCIYVRVARKEPIAALGPIDELVQMGFSQEESRRALEQAKGNLNRAVEILSGEKNKAPSQPSAEFSPDAIEFITQAGFTESQAIAALKQTKGDTERAVDLLLSPEGLSGPKSPPPKPPPRKPVAPSGNKVKDFAAEFGLPEDIVRDVMAALKTDDEVRERLALLVGF
jgi:uncharacterized UBP type Zn finger protein